TVAGLVRPVEAVAYVVMSGHVFDDDVIGLHREAIGELRLAIEDRRVAVLAANGQVGGTDLDGLVVRARRDKDEIARLRGVHGALDGRLIDGYVNHMGELRRRSKQRTAQLRASGTERVGRRRALGACLRGRRLPSEREQRNGEEYGEQRGHCKGHERWMARTRLWHDGSLDER